MHFDSTTDDSPDDDKHEVVERLENLLRLAKAGNISGVIVFAHHAGEGAEQSFSLAGMRHFNGPRLTVLGRELFARLESSWFDNEVSGTDQLQPNLGLVDTEDDK